MAAHVAHLPYDPKLASVQATLFTVPIGVPTLYFHGARDGCIGVELASEMDGMFAAGLRKGVLHDAGHFIHQKLPDKVNEEVFAFLQ